MKLGFSFIVYRTLKPKINIFLAWTWIEAHLNCKQNCFSGCLVIIWVVTLISNELCKDYYYLFLEIDDFLNSKK